MRLRPTFGPVLSGAPLIYVADSYSDTELTYCVQNKEGKWECYPTADAAARREGESTLHNSLPEGAVWYPQ